MRTQWIKADIEEPIEVHECEDAFFFEKNARREVNKYLSGEFEFVQVLYKDKPAYMLTNELGALEQLPINPRATDIYHNAVVKPRCVVNGIKYDAHAYAQIHGDIILVEEELT